MTGEMEGEEVSERTEEENRGMNEKIALKGNI